MAPVLYGGKAVVLENIVGERLKRPDVDYDAGDLAVKTRREMESAFG